MPFTRRPLQTTITFVALNGLLCLSLGPVYDFVCDLPFWERRAGFRYHHAEPTYLVLTLWLPDRPCTLPPNASHQVGIGAFVLNDKNEILAVQEKNGPLKGTGVWKVPTGLTNQGEDVFEGAIREVKEETGVDAKFLEVVGFRSQRLRQLRYLKLLDMGSGVRWKSREAAAVALEEPVSSLYEQMQEWEPVEALLAHSCVILSIDVSKAQVLNRACFGKPIYAATSPQRSASSASTRSPWFVEVDAEPENARLFQLGLEEAFFLASHLGCIVICKQSLEGREALSTEEVWRCMQRSQAEFGYLYTAYAHLRAKQWVVRSGIQYGADFMGYRHHPALVHSDYAVVVMVEGQEERVKTWTEVQAMNRLCGSVAKTLLLLHIIPKREGADMSSAGCEGDFTVEAVEVRRWLPEKNREESDRPI